MPPDAREILDERCGVPEPELLAVNLELLDGRQPIIAREPAYRLGRDCLVLGQAAPASQMQGHPLLQRSQLAHSATASPSALRSLRGTFTGTTVARRAPQ